MRIRNRTFGSCDEKAKKKKKKKKKQTKKGQGQTSERIEKTICECGARIVKFSAAITGHYHSHSEFHLSAISFDTFPCILFMAIDGISLSRKNVPGSVKNMANA